MQSMLNIERTNFFVKGNITDMENRSELYHLTAHVLFSILNKLALTFVVSLKQRVKLHGKMSAICGFKNVNWSIITILKSKLQSECIFCV